VLGELMGVGGVWHNDHTERSKLEVMRGRQLDKGGVEVKLHGESQV
jgi:hypothetical protein